MSLEQLETAGFRNLVDGVLSGFGTCNVVVGANAAGKTSLLEAIHVLGRARSFRAPRLEQVRRYGEEQFRVTGRLGGAAGGHHLGLERGRRHIRVRIDGADARTLSELAALLPVQVLNTDSQRLLQDGPPLRRSFLNWATFHVEQGYQQVWRRYERALRQRNAGIREGDHRLVRAWDVELTQAGEAVDAARRRVVQHLEPMLLEQLREWMPDVEIRLSYRSGWPRDLALGEALTRNRDRELELGYTLSGPHRADLVVRANGIEAQHWLSRGQQKSLVVALLLSQVRSISQVRGQMPVLLVDDLPAELDGERRARILEALRTTGAQLFITATEQNALPGLQDACWFHVEHGQVREMI